MQTQKVSIKGLSMTRFGFLGILMASVVALALCTTPVFAKDDSAAPDAAASKSDSATDSLSAASQSPNPSLAMAAASVSTDSLASFGPSSGTVVGNRALELRDSILRLRASVNLNSSEFAVLRSSGAAGAVQYHSTVAAITARLQNGTTRGNPILLRQWDEANGSLDEVTSSLTRLNSLETAVDADASMASYLLESVQAAFQLSGAVDEDHDQLKLLRDEVSRLVVQLDYLRNQTTGDIERQTTYLTSERSNLQALAFAISRGELLGNSMANRPVIVNTAPIASLPPPQPPYAPPPQQQQQQGQQQQGFGQQPPQQQGMYAPAPNAAPTTPVMPGVAGAEPMSPRDYMQETGQGAPQQPAPPPNPNMNSAVAPSVGRLLVLIRYNQPNVEYESQLSKAVGTALERRPNAEFSIVAVAPSSGDPADLAREQQDARTNAEAVKRSLVQLGLSPSRISMAAAQIQTAQTPEVHVYIR